MGKVSPELNLAKRHILWGILWSRIFDEVIEGLEDTGIGISRHHERVAFLLKDNGSTVYGWVNKCYHFETGTQFACEGLVQE